MRKILGIPMAVLGLSFSLLVAAPQGQGRGVGKDKATTPKERGNLVDGDKAERSRGRGHAFGKHQEKMVRDWFSNKKNAKGLPPGLAKREQLPPGLERHLQKHGTLPPGLQKRMQPLPAALEGSLPKPPKGVKRGMLGGDLVLYEESSNKILDTVTDVLPVGAR